MAIWEDHLLPLLTCKDAVRLECTCKALRGVVREHFRGDLGTIDAKTLPAALTTFSRARSVVLKDDRDEWADGEKEALLEWLREGGRGRYLEAMMVEEKVSAASVLLHEALQAGVLPSLRRVTANWEMELHRASLRQGFLRAVHELRLSIDCRIGIAVVEPQLEALGLVRHLPALTRLELVVYGTHDDPEPQWPPFIPPSLKALRIDFEECHGPPASEALLRALPGILEASGARLERLEMLLRSDFDDIGDGLVHVAQALRCCSPTLKDFLCTTWDNTVIFLCRGLEDYASDMEYLRVQWAGVLAGVSACPELQILALPPIEIEPLFPPGTAFRRLTHLQISDRPREHYGS
jgi:hypothetical protein